MSSPRRSSMIASAARELIAPVLRECPPECGVVSMTKVEVSPDYSYVTCSISALEHPEAALGFLERRTRELRQKLAALGLQRLPILRFRLDESAATARIEKILG